MKCKCLLIVLYVMGVKKIICVVEVKRCMKCKTQVKYRHLKTVLKYSSLLEQMYYLSFYMKPTLKKRLLRKVQELCQLSSPSLLFKCMHNTCGANLSGKEPKNHCWSLIFLLLMFRSSNLHQITIIQVNSTGNSVCRTFGFCHSQFMIWCTR